MANVKRKLLLGYWDCQYCGTKKIKGNLRSCPNCGKPRDENTRFYIDPNHKEYVPQEVAKKINRNSDWICNHCSQLNSDDSTHCKWCGSLRDSTNLDYHSNIAKQKAKEAQEKQPEAWNERTQEEPQESKWYDVPHSEHDFEYSANSSSLSSRFTNAKRHSKISIPVKPLLIALLALVVIGGLVFLLMPREYSGTVKAFAWERNILIERYQTVQESDWTLPVGARLRDTREEFYTTTQVLDHYETRTRQVPQQEIVGYRDVTVGYQDLGNGYFDEIVRSEPIYKTTYTTEEYEEPIYKTVQIYKTKYYYDVDKWLYERTVRTSGNNHEPYWGKTNLKSDERIGSKNQTYNVSIETSKNTQTYTMSYDDWGSLKLYDVVKFKVFLGNAKIIEE